MSSPTTKNVNVKQSNAAQDARSTRLRNTVELRKTRTEDRVKRLRNIEDDEESAPSVSYANGPSVSVLPDLPAIVDYDLLRSFINQRRD
jgi:hypothetical protein